MQKTNSSTVLLMFVAVLFGLLGVYAFRRMGNRPIAQQPSVAPQKLTIPLASRDLPVGRIVALSDVALVSMTKEQMKKQGISGMFMSDPKQVIGSTVMKAVKRGETFHTSQFYADGFRPNVTDRLKPGQRAVTILVDSEDALSGYAHAGQHVDLIFRVGEELVPNQTVAASSGSTKMRTWDPKLGYHAKSNASGGWKYTYDDRVADRNGNKLEGPAHFAKSTVTLLQDVEILALENSTVQDSAQQLPANETVRVTIAVSPDQAATLRAVEGRGAFSLSLRHPDDDEVIENLVAKSLEDILGTVTEPAPPEPAQRQVDEMEVYRGSSMNKLMFDGSHPLAVRINPEHYRKKTADIASADAEDMQLNQPAEESSSQGDHEPSSVAIAEEFDEENDNSVR